jgi:parvulin-like peptidyl-prolyl isomerase
MKSRPTNPASHRKMLARGAVASAILSAAALTAACKREEPAVKPSVADPVALEIGGRKIRLSELQSEVDLLSERRSPIAANLDAFLEPSIERLVALEQARKLGLDQDPSIRRQYENLLIGKLRESEIAAKLRETAITDEEIQKHFEANLAAYSRPAQIRIALLFLPVSSRADETTRAAVRTRLEEAKSIAANLPPDTRGFGEHAMTYSEEATSRFKGGDIGWLEAGASAYRWPEAVIQAAFALKEIGETSDVIEAADGYYLVKKLDARDAVVRSLDGRLRSTLEGQLLKEKRVSVESSLLDNWKIAHPVKLHPEVLQSLRFEVLTAAPAPESSIPGNP